MLVLLQIVDRNYIYLILYLPEGVHIWQNNWLLCVDYNKGLRFYHGCDLGVKVKYTYNLSVRELLFHVLTKGVHIWHNGCLWCVDYNTSLRSPTWLCSQRSNIFKISLTALKANSTFINPSTRNGDGIIGMSSSIQSFIHNYCISWTLWKFVERSGSVVESLPRDRDAAGSSLTGVTALCPWERHINSSVLVQPRKTRLYITEILLMGRKESNT